MESRSANSRLEAFCDGVFAIALTLLIIDVRIPSTETIVSTADFWRALQRLGPSVFAFVLSFGIILITWVNHHAWLKLVNKSSVPFMYANGLLLLSVVFVPFPTALLGEFILTDHAAPAVVLYNAVLAVQSTGWILMANTAIKGNLTGDARAASAVRERRKNGYFAFALYSLLSLAAFWLPSSVAVVTTLSWIFWLLLGVRMTRG